MAESSLGISVQVSVIGKVKCEAKMLDGANGVFPVVRVKSRGDGISFLFDDGDAGCDQVREIHRVIGKFLAEQHAAKKEVVRG